MLPFSSESNKEYVDGENNPKWLRVGGHMCMYYGDNTNKSAASYNKMAIEAYRLGNLK
jgi:hypothetical protein